MSITDAGNLFDTVQLDLQAEAANIAALVFPQTQFQLLSEKIGSSHAALILPKTQYELLSRIIGSDNLSITFKNPRKFSENFRLRFFPKIKTLILSGHYKDGMAHLMYIPANNYTWFNATKGYAINSPDCIGEKLEFLANKFYPFLEEFFIM
ncbi:MAG: hypothetical protein ACHBN1_31675 [Heteroscytonema crispum UTEX LB 1556]